MQCNGINGGEMKDRTNVISGRQKIEISIQKMKVLNSNVDTKVLTQGEKSKPMKKVTEILKKMLAKKSVHYNNFLNFFTNENSKTLMVAFKKRYAEFNSISYALDLEKQRAR